MAARVQLRSQWLSLMIGPAVLLGVMARVWLLVQPVDALLQWTVLDDAFYYLVIARHIAGGMGSTFDGWHATNGYHPLWMGVVVLLYGLLGDGIATLYAALAVESVLGLLGGLLLASFAARLVGSREVAGLIFALWAVNFRVLAFSHNGMESGAVMAALPLVALAALNVLERPARGPALWFGLACGIAVLARTDNAILVALFFLLVVWAHGWKPALQAAAGGLLVVLPWFGWNYAVFGTIVQSSATAITDAMRQQFAATGRLTPRHLIPFLAVTWFHTVKRLYVPTALPTGPYVWMTVVWLLGACGLALRRCAGGRPVEHLREKVRTFLREPRVQVGGIFLLAWPLVFTGVHVWGRWYFRPHYYASVTPSVLLLFGVLLWRLWRAGRVGRVWVSLLVPLTAFAAHQWATGPLYRHQIAAFHAAQWLNQHAEACPVVGVFNAGIMGMFATQSRVVNLDGVVNNTAAQAIRTGRLGEYARNLGVRCLADTEARPGALLDRPEWGTLRPAADSPLLWREEVPNTLFPWTSIYQAVWEGQRSAWPNSTE